MTCDSTGYVCWYPWQFGQTWGTNEKKLINYTDKEGIKRYSTDVISERIIPLESSGDSSSANSENNSSESAEVNEMPPVDNNDDLPF